MHLRRDQLVQEEVEVLTIPAVDPAPLGEIDDFLDRIENPLVHYCTRYQTFLSEALSGSELAYLIARDGNQITGILPFATRRHPRLGTVLNSLPFFGSHGGALVDSAQPDHHEVAQRLTGRLIEEAESRGVAALTVVENPLQPCDLEAYQVGRLSQVDYRHGQFTTLPSSEARIDEALLTSFHSKTRNAIRKGQRFGQKIEERTDPRSLRWLQGTHERSIRALGGIAKPLSLLETLANLFPLGDRARLFVGYLDGAPAAGLLVLLYRRTVEYFTPVVAEEHRDKQLLSDLIFHAMRELAFQGYRLWNWGGTWPSQEGVFRFKERWGAWSRPYRYFSRVYDPSLTALPTDEVLESFPFFYVFKF